MGRAIIGMLVFLSGFTLGYAYHETEHMTNDEIISLLKVPTVEEHTQQ